MPLAISLVGWIAIYLVVGVIVALLWGAIASRGDRL